MHLQRHTEFTFLMETNHKKAIETLPNIYIFMCEVCYTTNFGSFSESHIEYVILQEKYEPNFTQCGSVPFV